MAVRWLSRAWIPLAHAMGGARRWVEIRAGQWLSRAWILPGPWARNAAVHRNWPTTLPTTKTKMCAPAGDTLSV